MEGKRDDPLTREIIGAAIEVHKALGPGLLESAYERCLAKELEIRGLGVERQVDIMLEYKGEKIESAYRMDVVVGGEVVLEIKAIESLQPIHEAQILTYLRLSGLPTGLLLNFNTPYLRGGIKRFVI